MARDFFNNSGEQFDRMMADYCPQSREETLRRMGESIERDRAKYDDWQAKRESLVAAAKASDGNVKNSDQ